MASAKSLNRHRVVAVLDRRLGPGGRLPGQPLRRERERLQVHLLMIRMQDQRAGGAIVRCGCFAVASNVTCLFT